MRLVLEPREPRSEVDDDIGCDEHPAARVPRITRRPLRPIRHELHALAHTMKRFGEGLLLAATRRSDLRRNVSARVHTSTELSSMPRGPLSLLPKSALAILREGTRLLLRRPVVGICAVARTADGRTLLVRRADTGTWALPGGTVEWGETLSKTLERELEEEAGTRLARFERVVGVYSRPSRDPRFHAVSVVVACAIDPQARPPSNPLEIREARLFAREDIPRPLAMDMDHWLDRAEGSPLTRLE